MHILDVLEEQVSTCGGVSARAGCLDGITIMRYAHIERERTSGGVEQYLRHLHRALLQRHRLTILQTHLVRDTANNTIDVENLGIGRILWVPVPICMKSILTDMPRRLRYLYERMILMREQAGEEHDGGLLSIALAVLREHGGHLRHKQAVLSDHLSNLLLDCKVNLLIMHWMNYDAAALMARAVRTKVPFAFINHFDNARLSLPQNRKWIMGATAIGTVSDLGIPNELRDRCVNLSDTVDTEFFAPERVEPLPTAKRPIVLLPARIDIGKGHHDLMKAARILMAKKVEFTLCFVGAVESEYLHRELRRSVGTMGLDGRVDMLGEVSVEDMRRWYARSSVVALPSHSEGLGRVLLEAQAMRKPVVAYDCGGIRQALLPDKTGFLVENGNVEALASQIGFLLENESARRRLGQEGREFVSRQFGISAFVQRHEAFYLSALAGTGANGDILFGSR